jgi:hypothetical protein
MKPTDKAILFRDMLNWIKGKHNFKLGGEYLHLHFIQRFIGSPGFTFDGTRSGDPTADFMLGSFVQLGLGFGVRDNDDIQTAPSFFFQDECKVTPRLTFTYGIRYEPVLPWYDNHGKINAFVFGGHFTVMPDAPPGFLFPGDPGVGRGIIPADLDDFAPRIGFAWDVFGNGKTSVRGGYGVIYDSIKADSLSQENAPFAGFGNAYNGQFDNPFGSVDQINPPVVPSGHFGCVTISQFPGYDCPLLPLARIYINRNVRTPYVQSWNLTLERQVTPDIMLQASYIGKIGTKIEGWREYNPARFINDPVTGDPPSLNNANDQVAYELGILALQGFMTGNDDRSWYHSMQLQVTKWMSRGLSVTGSYTLAKSINISSYYIYSGQYADPFNLHDDRGRSSWDRRHGVVASWVLAPKLNFWTPWRNTLLEAHPETGVSAIPRVASPLFPTQEFPNGPFLDGPLGGWSLIGIATAQSGAPFTVVEGTDVALVATSAAGGGFQYAVRNGAPVTLSHPNRGAMVAQFFNTNAFVPLSDVPAGTIGDSGRNTITGPALSNTDFSIIKDFAVKERYKAQFRSEFFNVFNQVNFNNPNNSLASGPGVFGAILGASSGRQIQFGLKFLW